MKKRASKGNKINKDAWLATYGDMITLILVFFVLLYSMSTLDQEKYKLLVKAFTADPETLETIGMEESQLEAGFPDAETGGDTGEQTSDIPDEEIQDLEDLYEYLKTYVEQKQLESSVQVEKGDDFVYIRFMSALFFEPDRSVLKSDGKIILDDIGHALAQVENGIRYVRIDGHTAEASSRNNTVDDRALSTDRANVVLKFFEGNYIKDPQKLIAVGYGKYRPVAPNDSEENRAKNRRVEILVAKKDSLQEELDKIYEEIEDEQENDL